MDIPKHAHTPLASQCQHGELQYIKLYLFIVGLTFFFRANPVTSSDSELSELTKLPSKCCFRMQITLSREMLPSPISSCYVWHSDNGPPGSCSKLHNQSEWLTCLRICVSIIESTQTTKLIEHFYMMLLGFFFTTQLLTKPFVGTATGNQRWLQLNHYKPVDLTAGGTFNLTKSTNFLNLPLPPFSPLYKKGELV